MTEHTLASARAAAAVRAARRAEQAAVDTRIDLDERQMRPRLHTDPAAVASDASRPGTPPAVTSVIRLAGPTRHAVGGTSTVGDAPAFVSVLVGPLFIQCHDRVSLLDLATGWRNAQLRREVLPGTQTDVIPDQHGHSTVTGTGAGLARATVAVTLTGVQDVNVADRPAGAARDRVAHVQVTCAGITVLALDRVALDTVAEAWAEALTMADEVFPLPGRTG